MSVAPSEVPVSEPEDRPLRADALRNRTRLLAAAAEAFEVRGPDAPLEEIAKRAGVGIGTLYRHFPTRDVLVEAVYRHEVETLTDGVDQLLAGHPPDVALEQWMQSFVRYVGRKRGMVAALKSILGADADLFTSTRSRLLEAITRLVEAGSKAGTIRGDIEPVDLLGAMSGICMAADPADWHYRASRLVELLLDGLRFGAPNGANGTEAGQRR